MSESLMARHIGNLQANIGSQNTSLLPPKATFRSSSNDVSTPKRSPSSSSSSLPLLEGIESGFLKRNVLDAVVKVHAFTCVPNFELPWQMEQEEFSTCTAFAIHGNRLLTVAHGVLFHTVVRVKKRSNDMFYIARVLCVAEECDIALLTVDDETFWEGIPCLNLGSLPSLQDAVISVGYPGTGENICITSGVTSRIEMRNGFLTVQIDAAINPGNSGGPAFKKNGEVAGIAFQKNEQTDNTGFLIAPDVVKHFLDDYKQNGHYTGACSVGFVYQQIPDLDIRRYLKMNKQDSGVLVVKIPRKSPARGILKYDDVVLSVNDVTIPNSGTVPHVSGELLSFQSIIADKFIGNELALEILRDGEKMKVRYDMKGIHDDEIIPEFSNEKNPEYLVFGGLVFVVLTKPYLNNGYGKHPIPPNLDESKFDEVDEDIHQIILLSKVLNDEINVEYGHVCDQRVKKFNDIEIKSLVHFCELIDDCNSDFLRFELDYVIIVLDREKATAANKRVQETHHIPTMRYVHSVENAEGAK